MITQYATIHCASGPYGMSENVTGHVVDERTGITLCGRNTRRGGRWTVRYRRSGVALQSHDCKRCQKKAASLTPGVA